MTETEGNVLATSTRGGFALLKSISIFLTYCKSTRAGTHNVNKPKIKTKMGTKDANIKIPKKLLEAIKRDTHFSR